jgi:stromal membrane-associated protein
MEGPPPEDPSVLDGVGSAGDAEQEAPAPPPAASSSRPPAVTPAQAAAPVRSGGVAISPAAQQTARQLLSTGVAGRTIPQAAQPAAPPAQPAPAPATAAEDIFSLDFHAPASAAPTSPGAGAPKKDVKQDILSLFSSAPAAAPAPSSAFGQFGAAPAQGSPWDAFGAPAQAAPVPAQQSMMGGSGAGMWGVNSGWNAPAAPAAPAQPNIWGSAVPATAAPGMFNTNDVWASPAQSAGAPAASGAGSADLFSSLAGSGSASAQKKDDAFGDIWGGFK